MVKLLTQLMDMSRRKFDINEQKLILDVFNGTILTPQLLGGHLAISISDALTLEPHLAEKWQVPKEGVMNKINALSPSESALVEIWAVTFWTIGADFQGYLQNKVNLSTYFEALMSEISESEEILKKTKNAFKSKQVAMVRETLMDVQKKMQDIISY